MAKNQTNDDTFIDHDTGLILRRDPFEGNSHDVLGYADPSEWEILEEDFGPVVDWPTTPVLAGRLVNQKIVEIDHDDERGSQPTNIYCVEDAVTGERRAFYGNYQLDKALGCNPPNENQKSPYIGRMLLIRWEGKREQGKGGRTLNTYTVAIKRA